MTQNHGSHADGRVAEETPLNQAFDETLTIRTGERFCFLTHEVEYVFTGADPMKIRILEWDDSLRQLLQMICRGVVDDVVVGEVPDFCPAFADPEKPLPCAQPCGQMLIVDAHLVPLSGRRWLEAQPLAGCHIPAENKLFLSTQVTPDDLAWASALGCMTMRKPFRAHDLKEWVSSRLHA